MINNMFLSPSLSNNILNIPENGLKSRPRCDEGGREPLRQHHWEDINLPI